jgi:hypothetical protein
LTETYDIAGYARISVDDELDQKNVSIENQKAIIEDYVKHLFPAVRSVSLRIGIAPAIPSTNARAIRKCAGD